MAERADPEKMKIVVKIFCLENGLVLNIIIKSMSTYMKVLKKTFKSDMICKELKMVSMHLV